MCICQSQSPSLSLPSLVICQSFTNQNNSHKKSEFLSPPEKSEALAPMVDWRRKEASPARWDAHPLICPNSHYYLLSPRPWRWWEDQGLLIITLVLLSFSYHENMSLDPYFHRDYENEVQTGKLFPVSAWFSIIFFVCLLYSLNEDVSVFLL